jgi:hypothetical protein
LPLGDNLPPVKKDDGLQSFELSGECDMGTGRAKRVMEEVVDRMQLALRVLRLAYDYAHELHRDVWEFSIDAVQLQIDGMAQIDLQWLLCKGYAHCGLKSARGSVRKLKDAAFTKNACVVLTDDGARFANRVLRQPAGSERHSRNGKRANVLRTLKPKWDPIRRTLTLGPVVVKELKRSARAQERVFATFEELGWPECVDDPLPFQLGQNAKRRLHDTINNLNRYQKNRLIRFRSDGNGTGIRWKLTANE